MIKDYIINIPLVNQRKDTGDKNWAHKTCAICSLKMVLSWRDKRFEKLPVMNLVKDGLNLNGYLENIGWKHKILVYIALKYKLRLHFIKKFPKTRLEKLAKLKLINRQILKGAPVIVSIFYKLDPQNGGHMVLVHGLKKKDNKVSGYHIQDPDPNFKGHNYYLTKDVFLKGWRGGLIYSS